MIDYECPKCKNGTFKMIKDEEHCKFYGYEIWKLKCICCGEEIENDRYLYLLNTFSKTQNEVGNMVKEFSEDVETLKSNMRKLVDLKNNTNELDNILRKLNFIYLEENTDLNNNPSTIATLINANLPNGYNGEIQSQNNKNNNTREIKLKDDMKNNVGTIKVSRGLNNIMDVAIKINDKKYETLKIDKPFQIIKILLRLIEIVNFTKSLN